MNFELETAPEMPGSKRISCSWYNMVALWSELFDPLMIAYFFGLIIDIHQGSFNFGQFLPSPTWVVEHKLSLVMNGFKDWTGLNRPKAKINSSLDNSLNDLKIESSSSILTASEVASTRSTVGQVNWSMMSNGLSSHSSHSKPKHLLGALRVYPNLKSTLSPGGLQKDQGKFE